MLPSMIMCWQRPINCPMPVEDAFVLWSDDEAPADLIRRPDITPLSMVVSQYSGDDPITDGTLLYVPRLYLRAGELPQGTIDLDIANIFANSDAVILDFSSNQEYLQFESQDTPFRYVLDRDVIISAYD